MEVRLTPVYSSITSNGIKYQAKYYNQYILGIWENPTKNRKEENNMIESLNLIDIYAQAIEKNIRQDYNEKIDLIRKESSMKEKLDEILNNATEELKELYFSQFTEEQRKKFNNGDYIDQSEFSLMMREEIHVTTDGSLCINEYFDNEKTKKLTSKKDEDLQNLRKKVQTVKAHVAIAKTKEEVEEILKRYEILDKKSGKLVIE